MILIARRWHLLGVSAFALLVGSSSCSKSRKEAAPATTGSSDAPEGVRVIRVQDTTSGEQTTRELTQRIDHLRSRSVDPKATEAQQSRYKQEVVELYLSRAHFLGTVGDFGAALELADELVKTDPQQKRVYMLRAKARASLHDWEGTLADTETAQEAGVEKQEIDQLRALVAYARGDLDAAFVVRAAWAERKPDIGTLTDYALVLAAQGKIDMANNNFDKAVIKYKTVSPMPLAATWFQQGFMWERQGQNAKATYYYERALERLPQYAPLIAHMAGLEAQKGDRAKAIARLRELIKTADNPEYLGQLGQLLLDNGDKAEGERLIADARNGYEALLADHQRAFADHAARFYLGPGKNAARALELATVNLASRKTDQAYQLYLDAADAAKANADAACKVAHEAAARKYASSYALFAASRAYKSCGREADATKALAAADKATRAR